MNMAKGDSLKRYKIEQKAQTRKRIKEVIKELKETETETGKITVSKIATLSGITRASIYANYQDLLEDLAIKSKKVSSSGNTKEQNDTIERLRDEVKILKANNQLFMDQVVALTLMLKKDEI